MHKWRRSGEKWGRSPLSLLLCINYLTVVSGVKE
jgi:hypothetical protein